MELKNQGLMFSRKPLAQQDKHLSRDVKRTYSVYPINRMSRKNLEAARAAGSSPDVTELIEANGNARTTENRDLYTKKRTENEQFELSNSEPSEEGIDTPITPCLDLKISKTQKRMQSFSSGTSTPRSTNNIGEADTLKAELSRYKKELNDYNNATKELEQKYMKINVELGELQQTHERFIANRAAEKNSESTDSCRDGSEFSLKRKYTQVFHRGKSIFALMPGSEKFNDKINEYSGDGNNKIQQENESSMSGNVIRNKQKKSTVEFTFCQQQDPPSQTSSLKSCLSSKCKSRIHETSAPNSSENYQKKIKPKTDRLYDIYETLIQAMGTEHQKSSETKIPLKSTAALYKNKNISCENGDFDINDLENIIANLYNNQDRYRNVISEQQNCLKDYQARCQKAKQIMQTQQHEIEKLTINNKDLQDEVNKGIDKLRLKVDAKLRQVAPLTERLNEEQIRYQKVAKENAFLKEQKHNLQIQLKELKLKLDDLGKKKTILLNRLKNAERDLRVFRNYNAALKQEKLKHTDELHKLKEKMENLQVTHKRILTRQRELSDKQCRDLQRRVYELEQKLGRSNNSTSNLVIERDRLISELQAQINTLVHNFEVSQKHIRILRRHIHNAAGDSINVAGPTILKRKPLTKNQ